MKKLFIFYILGMILFSFILGAENEKKQNHKKGRLSFYLENDLFARTDRYYTNGVKLTWISPVRWLWKDDEKCQRAMSFSLGQNMYTPDNIEKADLIEDERPYAGYTYFEIGFHKKTLYMMDSLEFSVGIVGPHSFAEQTQKIIHFLTGAIPPEGWEHQLKDEFVLGVTFDRKWKLFRWRRGQKLSFELLSHGGGSLGNVMTAAGAGLQFRLGWHLPDDFGTFLIRPAGESTVFNDKMLSGPDIDHSFGFHALVSLEGQAVLRNLFLDGNTFQDSHKVEKKPLVADIVVGVRAIFKKVQVSYVYVYRTRQYITQKRKEIFGSWNISLSF